MAATEHVLEKSSLAYEEKTLFLFFLRNEKIGLDSAHKLYVISPWVSIASLMEQCAEKKHFNLEGRNLPSQQIDILFSVKHSSSNMQMIL